MRSMEEIGYCKWNQPDLEIFFNSLAYFVSNGNKEEKLGEGRSEDREEWRKGNNTQNGVDYPLGGS